MWSKIELPIFGEKTHTGILPYNEICGKGHGHSTALHTHKNKSSLRDAVHADWEHAGGWMVCEDALILGARVGSLLDSKDALTWGLQNLVLLS